MHLQAVDRDSLCAGAHRRVAGVEDFFPLSADFLMRMVHVGRCNDATVQVRTRTPWCNYCGYTHQQSCDPCILNAVQES